MSVPLDFSETHVVPLTQGINEGLSVEISIKEDLCKQEFCLN